MTSSRRIPDGIRAIGLAALCPVGFMIAALVVHLAVPWEPFIPSYTDRLEFYRERTDRFSMIFIGSSRMRAHVNPRIVDQRLGEEGESHHSFNLGIDSLNLIELNALVDEIIRLRPPALRYVVIEPVFSTNLPWTNVASERSIYFHDVVNTGLEIRCNLSLPAMRLTIGRSLIAAGYNLSNLGRLSGHFSPAGMTEGFRVPLRQLTDLRGYQAQDTVTDKGLIPWRLDFLEQREEMEALMRENRILQEGERFDMPCHFDAVLDMARRLRAAGIQPLFLNTPGFIWVEDYLSFEEYHRESGDPTPLLSYIGGNDDLYEHDLWYDPRHLKGAAAELFTRRLAEDLAGILPGASGL